MKKPMALLCYIFSGVLLFFALCCLFFGIFNPAVAVLLLGGPALACYTRFFVRIPKKLRRVIHVLAVFAALCAAVLVGVMVKAAYFTPPDAQSPPQTVVVLGAQIHGNQPSIMLARRLDAALAYMNAHPEASAVVSGGRGDDEALSESAVMKLYLTERGIAPARVFEEAASVNTGENLAFSARVIAENSLSTNVVICTDGFHQLRAALFAKRGGLSPSAISSSTPWGLVPMYYVREWVGLAKAVFLGK